MHSYTDSNTASVNKLLGFAMQVSSMHVMKGTLNQNHLWKTEGKNCSIFTRPGGCISEWLYLLKS